jgi:phosphoserine phosphatase
MTGVRACLLAGLAALALPALAQEDPLPSWNDGAPKQAILDFVEAVTTEGGDQFLPPEELIAVFDNDGTLWTEQPMYFQGFFMLERLKEMAPEHPEWQTTEPFKSALAGDLKAVAAGGEKGLFELLAATHAGMDEAAFEQEVTDWADTAEHPRFHRLFTELVYQPMLEVMEHLRDNDFETWIVSGGGIDFMRPWTERVYGIPPDQVVGSQIEVKYQVVGEVPGFFREPKVAFIDDGPGKPVGILRHIGRKPVIAFGNSDGDYEMLQYTTGGGEPRPHLAMIVHHTDAEREYAYDRDSHVGRLDRALDAAPDFGWILIDMKNDWATIYPPEG